MVKLVHVDSALTVASGSASGGTVSGFVERYVINEYDR